MIGFFVDILIFREGLYFSNNNFFNKTMKLQQKIFNYIYILDINSHINIYIWLYIFAYLYGYIFLLKFPNFINKKCN